MSPIYHLVHQRQRADYELQVQSSYFSLVPLPLANVRIASYKIDKESTRYPRCSINCVQTCQNKTISQYDGRCDTFQKSQTLASVSASNQIPASLVYSSGFHTIGLEEST